MALICIVRLASIRASRLVAMMQRSVAARPDGALWRADLGSSSIFMNTCGGGFILWIEGGNATLYRKGDVSRITWLAAEWRHRNDSPLWQRENFRAE